MFQNKKVVTRFAPSPTGFLHIGSVRTALFAYLWAKKHDGIFILRIEDTDKNREVEGSIKHIQESLKWLGINWDFGPDKPSAEFGSCIQSERLDIYKKYAYQLIDKGLAYPDPYTEMEINIFREKAIAQKKPFLFRNHRPNKFESWDGSQPLRFKVPEIKRYIWHDEIRGELSAGDEMLDDFILIKSDGFPTYNFAHIVDDLEMSVTHVMRGEEFISSMPKFLSLYDALEVPRPVFVTLPPIMGPDGRKKLSKRDSAKDLLDYKTDGYLPEAMINFLALIGWNPGSTQEYFKLEDLIKTFSLDKIQRSGGVFNEEKLKWMNKKHMEKSFGPEEKTKYVLEALPMRDSEVVRKLAPIIFERIHNQTEIREANQAGEYDWAFGPISYKTELLKWKNDKSVSVSKPRLQNVYKLLEKNDFSSVDSIKETLWTYAEEVGKGEILWPLRVALTGQEKSPDPFSCAYVLGKAETLVRIQTACDKIESNE